MAAFGSFSGTLTRIENFNAGVAAAAGCWKLYTVQNRDGSIVNFVVTPDTYFVDHVTMTVGNTVTGFYNANAPAPAIYPPQYQAMVMAMVTQNQSVKVDFFDSRLLSSDGALKLNISPYTHILLENDQAFQGNPANRNLIVVYSIVTMSIPAQTTPYRIIVMCTRE